MMEVDEKNQMALGGDLDEEGSANILDEKEDFPYNDGSSFHGDASLDQAEGEDDEAEGAKVKKKSKKEKKSKKDKRDKADKAERKKMKKEKRRLRK